MRNLSLVGALVAAIAVVGLIAACDNEPKTHCRAQSELSQPNVCRQRRDQRACSIPPGQSAQFTAISRLSDGTSQTATSVRWFSDTRFIRSGCRPASPRAGQLTGEGTLSAR